jgi:hypothetical protein
MARVPSMHPVASMREPVMPTYLPLPPEPPREELAVKDVENFDFEGAKPEYGIKTVENFDFDAARRSAEQADDNRVKAVENFDFEGARQAADDNRVKAVENFDFEAARQAGAQQDDNRVKAVENFDFEAARAAGAAAANQGKPEYGIKTVENFDFEAARGKIANAAAGHTNTSNARRSLSSAVNSVIAVQRMTTKRFAVRGPSNAPQRAIEAETDEESNLCVVCLEQPKSVVFLPCRHLATCTRCSDPGFMPYCPICRAPPTQRIEVFL